MANQDKPDGNGFDPLVIQKFLQQRPEFFEHLCFMLQHRLRDDFAWEKLPGPTPVGKSRALVKRAQERGWLGEVVCHIVAVWLEIESHPRILVDERIYEQLLVQQDLEPHGTAFTRENWQSRLVTKYRSLQKRGF